MNARHRIASSRTATKVIDYAAPSSVHFARSYLNTLAAPRLCKDVERPRVSRAGPTRHEAYHLRPRMNSQALAQSPTGRPVHLELPRPPVSPRKRPKGLLAPGCHSAVFIIAPAPRQVVPLYRESDGHILRSRMPIAISRLPRMIFWPADPHHAHPPRAGEKPRTSTRRRHSTSPTNRLRPFQSR